jgi:hypothetical protein
MGQNKPYETKTTMRFSDNRELQNLPRQLQELEEKEADLNWAYAVGRISRETYKAKLEEILKAKKPSEEKK